MRYAGTCGVSAWRLTSQRYPVCFAHSVHFHRHVSAIKALLGSAAKLTTAAPCGLLQGIHFLHAHNVIHSDLKTSNILLDRSQTTAKISDVGYVLCPATVVS
jgi:serine/threonine protein kinase